MGASKKFGVTSAAFAALVVSVATSSCGWLPKKVTEKDCNDWGDKFSKLTKDAFNENMKKCGKKATKDGDKAAKEAEADIEKEADKTFAKAIDEQTKELVKGCVTQVGKSYIAKDADCYMKASKMADWGSCSFQTPFFTDFSDLGKSFDKTMQSKCDEGIDQAKANKGGDDDEDDKKDKKDDKKKDKDDDD